MCATRHMGLILVILVLAAQLYLAHRNKDGALQGQLDGCK